MLRTTPSILYVANPFWVSRKQDIMLKLLDEVELFRAGEHGYHTFRIPALVQAADGTLLAFAEGRRHGRGDAGEIDLVLRRSHDRGESWSPLQVVAAAAGMTCGNPCPVLDKSTGVIWLPFCQNLADGDETLICEGKAPRTVWVTHSLDHGATWAAPREITAQVKRPDWTWYATGPGHGIQLAGGRLVIPCDHIVGVHLDRYRDPYYSHVIYSDDQGATWQIGGIAQAGTNECAVVAMDAQRLYLNCRNYVGEKRRAYAWSEDGGTTFGDTGWDDALVEPICQASMVEGARWLGQKFQRVYFANPAATTRTRLTVRHSDDGCKTWSDGLVLHAGPAAYSDLVWLGDEPGAASLGCLYERGEAGPYEVLAWARLAE